MDAIEKDVVVKTPVWLDCDTGHDDAYAILLAAHHPKSRLLGVSTVHGNASVDYTFDNSRAVLKAIGAEHVPLYKGAAKPASRPPSHAPDIHGVSGLDGVTLLPHVPPVKHSDDHYAETIDRIASAVLAEAPQEVQLVATGPLTNIAALLSMHPQVAAHVAGICVMGGAIGGGFTDAPLGKVEGQGERFGNWSPWAEFNIIADPEAAAFVLSHPALQDKLTLIALDLTHLVRGVPTVQEQLFPSSRDVVLSKIRRLFREVLMFFAATYSSVFGISDGPPLHDPLAVLAALQPELFGPNDERWLVRVVVNDGAYHPVDDPSNHVGQTVLGAGSQPPLGVKIPRAVDLARFWQTVDDALSAAEAATAALDLTATDCARTDVVASAEN